MSKLATKSIIKNVGKIEIYDLIELQLFLKLQIKNQFYTLYFKF